MYTRGQTSYDRTRYPVQNNKLKEMRVCTQCPTAPKSMSLPVFCRFICERAIELGHEPPNLRDKHRTEVSWRSRVTSTLTWQHLVCPDKTVSQLCDPAHNFPFITECNHSFYGLLELETDTFAKPYVYSRVLLHVSQHCLSGNLMPINLLTNCSFNWLIASWFQGWNLGMGTAHM